MMGIWKIFSEVTQVYCPPKQEGSCGSFEYLYFLLPYVMRIYFKDIYLRYARS